MITLNRHIIRKNLTIIILLIAAGTMPAAGQRWKFFTPGRELTSSLINEVMQDSRGMLWIATEDGLNRYDGAKFTTYHSEPGDTTSLYHNFVSHIYETTSGDLLLIVYDSVQMYDPGADRFTSPLSIVFTDGRPLTPQVTRFYKRDNGEELLLADDIYRIVTTTADKIVIEPLNSDGKMVYYPKRVTEDSDGNLWILSGDNKNQKVSKIDRKNHLSIIQETTDEYFDCITTGDNGTIYAGSLQHGFYRYDPAEKRFIRQGDHMSVSQLYNDPLSQSILIATDGQGLKAYNERSRKIKDFVASRGDFHLPGDKIHHVIRDNHDNYWISLYQKGVMMVPDHQSLFGYIGTKSSLHNVIGDKSVTSLLKDSKGILWVGTDHGGIYALNPDITLNRHYNSGVSGAVMGMHDMGDKIMVGFYIDGCTILDKATGATVNIPVVDDNSSTNVYGFTEDRFGNLWVATMGKGLMSYNPERRQLEKHDNISDNINKWISTIQYSKSHDKLLLGTYDGLWEITDYASAHPQISQIEPATIVHSIKESPNGQLWCGTSNGLFTYNPETGVKNNYSTAHGLSSSTVNAIENEGIKALWVSTNTGISRFDLDKATFTNYHADDGLQGTEFYKNASFRDNRGLMYFGGMDGITYFSPAEIKDDGVKYNVRIADVYLHGTPIRTGMKSGHRTIVDKPVYEAEKIKLSHNDNSFAVEFSTLELDRPESVRFIYSLDNENWETLPHGLNRVNFSNINPGVYTLRVKAVDNGIESDVTTLTIDISPVWYRSWWAMLLYALTAVAIGFFAWWQYRVYRKQKLESLEREQADLIKETRLQFFTNISHEIRTPMTLVISPLEKLMTSDSDSSRQKEYRLIHRNAKRILRLINEIMDLRKIDKSQMKLSYSETTLTPFIEDIVETFRQVTADKNITLKFNHDGCDGLTAWVDTANFDKIIMNLLSNAVKFTEPGGQIEIGLSHEQDDSVKGPLSDFIKITVSDSGIGIPEEDRRHIFERYFQVDPSNIKGTGIGLHLVNSLVKLHQGTIEVDENPAGKGTRFTIRLPYGNSHLNLSDMALSSEPTADLPHHQTIDTTLPMTDDEELSSKPTGSDRILVVEDDEEIRRYIVSELSKKYRVEECSNGKEALEILFKKAPSLIISDVMMPEIDGITLTRRIKKNINLHHIPIILLTAKTRESDTLEGLESGADAYITKPFNIDILLTTVHNLLSSRKKLRNVYGGKQTRDDKVNVQVASNDEKVMERIMKVIDKNIDNPDITVETLAEEVGMSRVHLHRKLKELTNQSPRDFIRNTRLRVAAKLMVEKRLNISEAAIHTGFRNPNNFATSFKELFGMTPTEYITRSSLQNDETSDNETD